MQKKTVVVVSSVVMACAASAGVDFAVERDIRYSDASENCVLDARWPQAVSNFATVVNFHGGGLTKDGKSMAPWPAEGVGDAVAQVGVRYRCLGQPGVTPADCLDDAAAATAWAIRHVAARGGDQRKVFITGVSAGGYLSAMVGLDARLLAKYGLQPNDLAGVVPLTGQMTKHFNVRKIGFADKDPKYQPKIDEWAPLFYAGAKNLPPFSFCCGGRDVEWPSRVEENELLAVSLRNCGNYAEFHETEGDHGGGTAESAYFLRDFVMKRVDAHGIGRFEPGERIACLGDSITHAGFFVAYLQLFQSLRNPGCGTRFYNFGCSGNSASNGIARWPNDVMPSRPNRALVMFGMNDVNREVYRTKAPRNAAENTARLNALGNYETNMIALVEQMRRDGVKTALITPSPYNQYFSPTNANNFAGCNDPGLAACSARIRRIAADRALGVVDMHAALTRIFAENATVPFCNDRVHPDSTGHLLMAATIVESAGYSPVLARAVIDAKAKRIVPVAIGKTKNCRITRLDVSTNRVAFTYAPKALPFPNIREYANAERFHPLTRRLNRELIVISGLEAGLYALSFDGREVGRFDAAAFAAGVNVALLDTPNQRRAMEASKIAAEMQQLNCKRRDFALCVSMLPGGRLRDDRQDDEFFDKWLESEAKSQWIGAFRAWVRSYRAFRPVRERAEQRLEDLFEAFDAVRPAVSRVTVERVGDATK